MIRTDGKRTIANPPPHPKQPEVRRYKLVPVDEDEDAARELRQEQIREAWDAAQRKFEPT